MIEEQKSKKGTFLFIIIILLVGVISISFAYFVAKNFINKNETGEVNVHTADSGGTKLTVENEEASDNNMYPGHKKLVKLTVTALYNNGDVYYNIYWKGTNTLANLKYTIYKVEDNPIENIDITCDKKQEFKASGAKYYEECNLSDETSLGKVYNSGTINYSEAETNQTLKKQEVIVGQDAPGKKVYYYIVLEYPNNEESQNDDFEKGYDGIFDIEITEFASDVPENLRPLLTNLKKEKPNFRNTSCINATNNSTHDSSDCDEQTNGIYAEETNLGTTYYYRGTVNNNWVKFGKMGTEDTGDDIWWRIIRINEDGTLRLIYAGTGDEENVASPNTIDGVGGYWISKNYGINNNTDYKFNTSDNQNAYAGFMYGTPGSIISDGCDEICAYKKEHGYDLIDGGKQNELKSSDAKTELDNWYVANLKDEVMTSDDVNILSGSTGFCGDRSLADGYGYGQEKTDYKAHDRLGSPNYQPSYECPNEKYDLYTTSSDRGEGNGALENPIGLITADEINYAGGKYFFNNYGYWLCAGQQYLTLSPGYFSSISAIMYVVLSSGKLEFNSVNSTKGLRPVVNLKPEYLQTTGHDGTVNNPYIATADQLN